MSSPLLLLPLSMCRVPGSVVGHGISGTEGIERGAEAERAEGTAQGSGEGLGAGRHENWRHHGRQEGRW